jgi:hypothetical protein
MSKVWTYIISKNLSENDLLELKESGLNFVSAWTAHENKLSASFDIYKNKIIIVKVNEALNTASGCSIDKLTRFIKETEKKYSLELLNRFLVAYKKQDDIEVTHATNVKILLSEQKINADTLIFNTSVSNQNEFSNWEQPLRETWLNKYLL